MRYGIMIILILGLLIYSYGVQIKWTGNMDSYWHNEANWEPKRVPTQRDDVYIGINVTVPPYINKEAEGKEVRNELMIDVYGTNVKFERLINNGEFCIYRSQMSIEQPMNMTGQLRLIESSIRVPSLTLSSKYSQLSGTGVLNTTVHQIRGRVLLKPNHILAITKYIQEREGELLFEMGQNLILTNSIILSGQLLFDTQIGNFYEQTIIHTVQYQLNQPHLIFNQRHIYGHLSLVSTPPNSTLINIIMQTSS